jgi:hypothetical protein
VNQASAPLNAEDGMTNRSFRSFFGDKKKFHFHHTNESKAKTFELRRREGRKGFKAFESRAS